MCKFIMIVSMVMPVLSQKMVTLADVSFPVVGRYFCVGLENYLKKMENICTEDQMYIGVFFVRIISSNTEK